MAYSVSFDVFFANQDALFIYSVSDESWHVLVWPACLFCIINQFVFVVIPSTSRASCARSAMQKNVCEVGNEHPRGCITTAAANGNSRIVIRFWMAHCLRPILPVHCGLVAI